MDRHLPKGWSRFICHLGGNYTNFGQVDSRHGRFKQIENRYRTDVEGNLIKSLIENDLGDSSQPFLLCWCPFAPHSSSEAEQMSSSRHADLFDDEFPSGLRDQQIFANGKDRPSELSTVGPLPEHLVKYWSEIHQQRLKSLTALDESIGKLWQALKDLWKT